MAFFAFLLAGLGGLVVRRAARSDVTYAFLGFYALLVIGRAVWLGDPRSPSRCTTCRAARCCFLPSS